MSKITVKELAVSGLLIALYVAITLSTPMLAYMGVQFRIAEALTLVCFYNKKYIVPLTLACLIVNAVGPMPAYDVPFGTAATLIALLFVSRSKNIYIASIFPVVINAVIVALELKLAFNLPIFISMAQVAFGQFVCVCILGIVLFKTIEKNKSIVNLLDLNHRLVAKN